MSRGGDLGHSPIAVQCYSQLAGYIWLTGEDGRFLLDNLPPGIYQLLLEHAGYSSVTLEVEVTAGETADLGTISLSLASSVYLPVVVRME